jgi:mRNA interferase MazF
MVEQYSIYWVELDPTRGGEMAKTRPCVVVSPTELNMYLTTAVIVPVTSTIRNYPFRVRCSIAGRDGEIATDQIRVVDKGRLKRKIGMLNSSEISELQEVFNQMFCL